MSKYLFCESRSLELRFDPEVPPEVENAIQPLLERHAWLIPSYVHFVFVRWTHEDGDAALSATVAEEYRRSQTVPVQEGRRSGRHGQEDSTFDEVKGQEEIIATGRGGVR
jgi:hypothetical protein